MILVVAVLVLAIAVGGGFLVGVSAGAVLEREWADRRRPLEPHEILRELRGPLGLAELPAPKAPLWEPDGPCDYDDRPLPFELQPGNRSRSSHWLAER